MKILPVGDLRGPSRGESSPWRRSESGLNGRILASGKQSPTFKPPVWFCSGRPAWSSGLLLQPTAFAWAAGGPRAEPSSHSPQCRRIFSITSV
jgi:hypothetical protein